MISALNIHVTGIVQGVGFRPFVYRLAKQNVINGWVLNSADGVHIHAEGEDSNLDAFCLAIANEAPAAAKVEQVEMKEIPLEHFDSFTIKTSEDENMAQASSGATLVSPDLATCPDCVRELFDRSDRRYHYPFINCTNCGPRFTIIGELPYDRCNTSMAEFKMCEPCASEYADPMDRRFHAQPDACFDCGPKISWTLISEGIPQNSIWGNDLNQSDAIIEKACKFLHDGKIVAIKGLGGFHLACDATNEDAVKRLRSRKERSNKAFAVMASDIDYVRSICKVNKTEQSIFTGSVRPIVLLKNKEEQPDIAKSVAMGLPELGVMLPYTPLQHLILHLYNEKFYDEKGCALVMTSGNICDSPIVTDDEEALQKLGGVADAILGNNRKILTRYDDSVLRVIDAAGTEAIQFIRRARGYAPAPIKVNIQNDKFEEEKPAIFACGPEQKNTFSFLRYNDDEKHNAEIFVGQHIGDVEDADVYDAWIEAKNRHSQIFRISPDIFACDNHPEYLTTKWCKQNIPAKNTMEVQHHFAHIASVIAENYLEGPVAGFSFDGTGFGADGQIWGGEVLIANSKDYERFANFAYMPMPGGAACVKNPLQMAYGILHEYDLLDHPTCKKLFDSSTRENLSQMIESGINTPYTSSLGRIFDAVSAILGICPKPTYEGEAATMLEAYMTNKLACNSRFKFEAESFDARYAVKISKNSATENSTAHDTSVLLFDISGTLSAILDDVEGGVAIEVIGKNFHDAIVLCVLQTAQLVQQIYGITTCALAGGCFMNRYLVENCTRVLTDNGFSVALNNEVPPNDGSISLGQAFVAANNLR